MDLRTLSGTAEFSDEEAEDDFQHPPVLNEVKAKFAFTEEQVYI